MNKKVLLATLTGLTLIFTACGGESVPADSTVPPSVTNIPDLAADSKESDIGQPDGGDDTRDDFSAEEIEGLDDFDYEIMGDEVMITGYFGEANELTYPSVIEGRPATSTYESSCVGNIYIESLTMPDSYQVIGAATFAGCENLKTVVIGNGMTEIGMSAFGQCRSLENIVFGDSVEKIAWEAFVMCTSLKSVVLPDSIREIGNAAFADCCELEDVTIPSGITKIGKRVFDNAKKVRVSYNGNIYTYDDLDSLYDAINNGAGASGS